MEVSRSDTRQPTRGPARLVHRHRHDHAAVRPEGRVTSRGGAGSLRAWRSHCLAQASAWVSGWSSLRAAAGRRLKAGPSRPIRAGDVVWCPPGVRHWHGATPTTAMAHIAIQEAQNGSPVTWMEHVSDEQYRKGPQ